MPQNSGRQCASQYHFVGGAKKIPPPGRDSIQAKIYFLTAFLALSATVFIADFAVSATALMVESTLDAVESTTFFALSTTVETAESVLAAASLLPPPQDVKAAAITSTVRNFFISVIFSLRKNNYFRSINKDI
jgi:hypothetical protein